MSGAAVILISVFAIVLAAIPAIPVFAFLIEVVASFFARDGAASVATVARVYGRLAVLVPAHNESAGMRDTLSDIKAQLRSSDRLLVVADNCSDDTAEVAAAAGAEVVARNEPDRIGKGYALDFGLKHLANDPPDIVAVIDADCRLGTNALAHLASACAASGRPAQALNLMVAPERSASDYRVAIFAFRVKNFVRALGASVFDLPCQLTGTGMALPWEAMRRIDLATGLVVEDLKLGLDMAEAGYPAAFCPEALITSAFPTTAAGAAGQRRRWESGHLAVIKTLVPRLISRAIATGNMSLFAAALDASIPPLTLLGFAVALSVVAAGLAGAIGASGAALAISGASLVAYVAAVALSWVKCGRDLLPASAIPSLALSYLSAKLALYRRLFAAKDAGAWVRADRTK